MKIALLGTGKTGSKIVEAKKHEVKCFNSKQPPTFESLKTCDVIISFLPGDAFLQYLPLLIETKLPVICGSTGFKWPQDFDKGLKEKNLSWIYATNFSLGVFVIKELLKKLNAFNSLFPNSKISIHEVHHIHKKDAPSGTALSMQEWIGLDCEITSAREGDVIGHHELTLNTGSEKIMITHEALDRKLFAEGAIWAAEYLYKNKRPGLHSFQSVLEDTL